MHYLRIKPNDGHVLVRHCIQEKAEVTTDGGIILPPPVPGREDSMRRSVVLAIGNDVMNMKIGDYVYVHIHGGTPIEVMQQARSGQSGQLRIVKVTEISCIATPVESEDKDCSDVIEAMDVEDMTALKKATKSPLVLSKPSPLILPK